MASYDGRLKFDTEIVDRGFKEGLSGLKKLAGAGAKATAGLMAGAGAAVVGFGAKAVQAGSDFDSAMSEVQAISGATGQDLEMLRGLAKELGASTSFSATQAAEGLQYMSLAGWDAQQSYAALPSVLNLAGAAGMDLATASDILTDTMTMFGMEAEQATTASDMFAKTQMATNTTVDMLGEAMKYAGSAANASNMDLAETNAILGMFANGGIKGSQAGTTLAATLNDIKKNAKNGAIAIGETSVSVYDAEGNFRGLGEIMTDVEAATAGMTDAQRDAALAQVFGQQSMKGLNVLLEQGMENYWDLEEAIRNSAGSAEEAYAIMRDNLQGDIDGMKSALEGFQIAIFENIEAPLREVVQTGTEYLAALTKAMEGGIDEVAKVGGEIIADLVTRLAQGLPKIIEVGTKIILSLMDGLRSNMSEISAGVADVLAELVKGFVQIFPEVMLLGAEIIANVLKGFNERAPELLEAVVEAGQRLIDGFTEIMPMMLEQGMLLLETILEGIRDNMSMVTDAAFQVITFLGEAFIEYFPMIVEIGVEILVALIEGMAENMDQVIEVTVQIIETILLALAENAPLLIEAGLHLIVALIQGITENIDEILEVVPLIIGTLIGGILSLTDDLIIAGKDIIKAIVSGFTNSIYTLEEAVSDMVRAIFDQLDLPDWASKGLEIIGKIASAFLNPYELMAAVAEMTVQVLTKITDAWSNAKEQGAELLRNIKSGIDEVKETVFTTVSEFATNTVNKISELWADAASIGRSLISGIIEGFKSRIGDMMTTVAEFGSNVMSSIKGFFGIASPSQRTHDEVGAPIMEGITGGMADGSGGVLEFFGGFGEELLSAAVTSIEGIWENSRAVTEQGWNLIKGAVTQGISGVTTGVTKGFTAVQTSISNAWESVKSTTANTWGALKSTVSSGASNVKNVVNTAWNGIKSVTQSIWNGIKTVISGAWSNIKSTASSAVNSVKSTVTNAWNNIKSTTQSVFNGIKSVVSSSMNAVKSTVSNISDAIKSVFTNVWNSFKDVVSQSFSAVHTAVSNGMNQAQNVLSGFVSSFTSVGRNLIQGVANGIANGASAVVNAAQNAARSALNAAKSFLGIHSPSKRMEDEVGEPIPEGMAKGIDNKEYEVIGALQDIIDHAVDNSETMAEAFDKAGYEVMDSLDIMREGGEEALLEIIDAMIAFEDAGFSAAEMAEVFGDSWSRELGFLSGKFAEWDIENQQYIVDWENFNEEYVEIASGSAEAIMNTTMENVDTHMNLMIMTIAANKDKFVEAMEIMGHHGEDVWNNIAHGGSGAQGVVASLIGEIANMSDETKQSEVIARAFGSTWDEWVNSVVQDFGMWTSETDIGSWVLDQEKLLEHYQKDVEEKAVKPMEEVSEKTGETKKEVSGHMKEITDTVKETVGQMTEVMDKEMAAAMAIMKESLLKNILPTLKETLTTMANETQVHLKDIFISFRKTFNDLITLTVQSFEKTIAPILQKTMKDMTASTLQATKEMLDQFIKTFGDLGKGFDENNRNVSGSMNRLLNIISSRSRDFYNVARDLMNGFNKGMIDGINEILDTVSEGMNLVMNQMKSDLDIHSPSRRGEKEVGLMLMKGIDRGVLKGFADVKKTIRKEMPEVIHQFKTFADRKNYEYGLAMAGGSVYRPSSLNKNDDGDPSFSLRGGEIHTTVELDGREVGKSVSPIVSEEISREKRRRK